MPWKVTCVMEERFRLIDLHQSGDYPIAQLARQFGVSRKTVYKWIERYQAQGIEGLGDRSRVPHRQPSAVPERIVEDILHLKGRYPTFGAPKVRVKLLARVGADACPAESTIGEILKRHGLTKPRKHRRHVTPNAEPSVHCQEANEVWCADFKGWFRCGNGKICTPLTISDGHTRYLIRCVGLHGNTGFEAVRPIFEAAFRQYGMPGVMRTDNGPPFASVGFAGLSRLAVWLIRLGIKPERIRLGKPQDNGRHERMHRTLKETVCAPPRQTLKGQQEAFDAFLVFYNFERPHEALGQQPPGQCYAPSPREFPERLPPQRGYPDDWETRTVHSGQMRWRGKRIHITRALSGQRIGLEPTGDKELWRIWFENILLGEFDERRWEIRPIREKD